MLKKLHTHSLSVYTQLGEILIYKFWRTHSLEWQSRWKQQQQQHTNLKSLNDFDDFLLFRLLLCFRSCQIESVNTFRAAIYVVFLRLYALLMPCSSCSWQASNVDIRFLVDITGIIDLFHIHFVS